MLSLVTGGAGFLGSHIVDMLLAEGDDVLIVDNLCTGSLRNIDDALRRPGATFVYLDVARPFSELRDPILEAGHGKAIGKIFHFAAPARPKAYDADPWEALYVNAVGTMSLVELAVEQQARFIYASTAGIYADPLVDPLSESHRGNVGPVSARSYYHEGKRFGEAAVAAAFRKRDLDARIVRFFHCYGPRMQKNDGQLIPALFEAAANGRPLPIEGTGEQTRSLTYVGDAIKALSLAVQRPQPTLEPINIGNDHEHSVIAIATALANMLGVEFLPSFAAGRPDDPQRSRPDISDARKLGWMPETSLEDGLRHTYEWFSRKSPLFV